jgi:hypothetical protein
VNQETLDSGLRRNDGKGQALCWNGGQWQALCRNGEAGQDFKAAMSSALSGPWVVLSQKGIYLVTPAFIVIPAPDKTLPGSA